MQGKSKKIIADKGLGLEKQTKYIPHSSSNTVNRLSLSLSFYGQATLKMQKQVIMESYDDFQNDSPSNQLDTNETFYSVGLNTQSTPSLINFEKQQQKPMFAKKKITRVPKPNEIKDEKNNNVKGKQKAEGHSSQQKKKVVKNPYFRNKIVVTSKVQNTIRPLAKEKGTQNTIRQSIKEKVGENTIRTVIKEKRVENTMRPNTIKEKIGLTKKT